jgi:rubrerythrin
MNDMTKSNLQSAYGGESMAHMRYLAFAVKAEEEGYKNISRLFNATSFAEQVHATNHFKVMKDEKGDASVNAGAAFGYLTTLDSLELAIGGEKFEIEQMYPAYISVAKMQGEKNALRSMEWALEVEKHHFDLFNKAKDAVASGKDVDFAVINVCSCCGATLVGDFDSDCPVCGAKKHIFKTF